MFFFIILPKHFIVNSLVSHSIDADEFKEGLLYENGTNIMDSNEYIKHFLLLVLQAIAMFVVCTL